ncbi:copper homeostasis protein CutC [Eubacteriales bacterium OttesenSCG-928-M02]|nr:copper homeostasis protein CutC [Eubacteriales bacterium OttesenSCG-928-M02]
MGNITLEVCCGSVDGCIIAQNAGADRIELNHALELGGTTPSIGTLVESKKHTNIPIVCMVRPRGVGYYHSEEEFAAMLLDVKTLMEYGADGIVFGFLTPDGTVDTERTKIFVDAIHPKEAIFSKAFDKVADLEAALLSLIHCGVNRVLTSGGAISLDASHPDTTQEEVTIALSLLKRLHATYGDKIQLLPGGGIRAHNVIPIIKETGILQIHTAAREMRLDPSSTHFMKPGDSLDNYRYSATSPAVLAEITKALDTITPLA